MNAGPYSNEQFQAFVQEQFIPLKTQVFWDKQSELMERFTIKWTPTLIIHDKEGREHHRMVGFVPVDDLIPHLMFGKGKVLFDGDHLIKSIEAFRGIVEQYPDAGIAPEAVYYRGVAEYKRYHDAAALRRIYDALAAKYPQSEWARRAQPYSQIPAYSEV